jgi:hypothetical protein
LTSGVSGVTGTGIAVGVSPLSAVSAAVRHVALYVADRTSADLSRREIRPAAIEIITGGASDRRRSRHSA